MRAETARHALPLTPPKMHGPSRAPSCASGFVPRRVSAVPVRLIEGPLTEPTPAAQPSRREPLFMSRWLPIAYRARHMGEDC
jgi:hypothetical protein